jgi:uncharacterized membrane protein YoaK (UPF0700 family)
MNSKLSGKMDANLPLFISAGIFLGAVAGLIAGIQFKDIAMWLSIGVGSGMLAATVVLLWRQRRSIMAARKKNRKMD